MKSFDLESFIIESMILGIYIYVVGIALAFCFMMYKDYKKYKEEGNKVLGKYHLFDWSDHLFLSTFWPTIIILRVYNKVRNG